MFTDPGGHRRRDREAIQLLEAIGSSELVIFSQASRVKANVL
jgi:hypothetical protein